jgi:uncharacterized protein
MDTLRSTPEERANYSFSDRLEEGVDVLFRSSAVIAAGSLIVAVVCLLNGWLPWAGAAVLAALAAGVGVYARFVVPFRLTVRHLHTRALLTMPQAAADGQRRMRVVFFSDLHLGEFKRADWARRVVALVNEQHPDLVLIGGDFVGRMRCCDPAELFEPLRELRAPAGVFAVLGNHDYGIPGPDYSDYMIDLLPRFGVRVLRNDCVRVSPDVEVVGLDELWAAGSDFKRAADACGGPGVYTLVLGHNPDVMLGLRADDVRDPGRTLFLFGHTHHGQIRVPFLPGAAVPIKGRLYRGEFKLPQGAVYVSAGTGENTSPTRLGTSPEIVVFDLVCG